MKMERHKLANGTYWHLDIDQNLRELFKINKAVSLRFLYKDLDGDIITVTTKREMYDAVFLIGITKMELILPDSRQTGNIFDSAPVPTFSSTVADYENRQPLKDSNTVHEPSSQQTQTLPQSTSDSSLQTESSQSQLDVDATSLANQLSKHLTISFDPKAIAEDVANRIWNMLKVEGVVVKPDIVSRALAQMDDTNLAVDAEEIHEQLNDNIRTPLSVYCDGPDCKVLITGIRYKCMSGCFNFDLCPSCELKGVITSRHSPNHNMLKVKPPNDIPADARLVSDTIFSATHKFVYCDLCNYNIVGLRWKCGMCVNFDVCASCLTEIDRGGIQHPQDHCFIRIVKPLNIFIAEERPLLGNIYRLTGGSTVNARKNPCNPIHHEPTGLVEDTQGNKDKLTDKVPPSLSIEPISEKPIRRMSRLVSELFSPTSLTPSTESSEDIYKAVFIRDVTYPDGMLVFPKSRIEKTWSFTNCGDAQWPNDVQLVRVGGHKSVLIDAEQKPVPAAMPGENVNVSVILTLPSIEGRYITYFRLVTKDGTRFGHRVWLDLQVDEEADDQNTAMATSSMIFPKLKFDEQWQNDLGTRPASCRSSNHQDGNFSSANSVMSTGDDMSVDIESITDTKTSSDFSRRSSSSFAPTDDGDEFVVIETPSESKKSSVADAEEEEEQEEDRLDKGKEKESGNQLFHDEDESNEIKFKDKEKFHDAIGYESVGNLKELEKTAARIVSTSTIREPIQSSEFQPPIESPSKASYPGALELKLRALAEMGFNDTEANSELLKVHHGNLESVISALLETPERRPQVKGKMKERVI